MPCVPPLNIPEGKGKCGGIGSSGAVKHRGNIGDVDPTESLPREGGRRNPGCSLSGGAVRQRRRNMLTFVLDKEGRPLMPTYNIRKVRKKLKAGKVRIAGHDPFTVQLLYDLPKQQAPRTQPVELCLDTGKEHIGLSVKSEKHEYVSARYDNLPDEKKRHDACRSYRRTRRNRKRYRRPRSDNRKKEEGWLAPTVRHAIGNHEALYGKYRKVCPVTDVYLEVAGFDTQALEAVEKGLPLPRGKDYQQGPRYGTDTLRQAVFERDGYTCRLCGRNAFEKDRSLILNVHHAFYWRGDHTDRMDGLVTLCTSCHTAGSHQKGGKLYGWEPEKTGNKSGASFMNQARWVLYEEMKALCEKEGVNVRLTYGVTTKRERHSRRITKSHANDAYCMGTFRPKHRTPTGYFRKRRRNERSLTRFYNAKYVDTRTGETVNASALGCGRTNRRETRNTDKNLRPYRGRQVRKGRVSVKRKRSPIPTGSLVRCEGRLYVTKGTHNLGTYVTMEGHKSVRISTLKVVRLSGGWIPDTKKS